MRITIDRDTLALDLRTFGEDELADQVPDLSDEDLTRIQDRADHYLYPDSNGLIPKAASLAAVDVIEGQPRPLRWKRRKLEAIYPGW